MSRSIVREKAFVLSIDIIKLCDHINEHKYQSIRIQLLRSGTSVGANIVEALESESLPDFIHKMSIALKECSETIYWLELILETGILTESQLNDLIAQGKEIRSILRSIIISSKKKVKS